jgi:AAA family ATP:ADP antiporter
MTLPEKWRLPVSMACASLSAACLVGAYEFVRTPSTTIFMDSYGAAKLPYALSAVPFMMAALIYLYARLLSLAGPMRTILASMLLTGLAFVWVYTALPATGHAHGMLPAFFYIFGQAYIVIFVEQYWAFINSTLNSITARVYNGPIAGGGALGPVLADWMVHKYAVSGGTAHLILFAAAAMLPAALLIWISYLVAGEPKPSADEAGAKKGHLHLSLIKEQKALLLLMCTIFLTQIIATVLDLKLSTVVESAIPGTDARSQWFGGFWMSINSASAILQFIVAPLLLRLLPIAAVMVAIPSLHLVAAVCLIAHPTLLTAALALGMFKAIDYSIFRAGKELVYIPLSFDARYRAKQLVDAFTYRFSKGVTALSLSAWESVMPLLGAAPLPPYSAIAACAAALWVGISVPLGNAIEKSR